MGFREFPKNNREIVRIGPGVYEGHDLINVRVYAPNRETGEIVPTRKGISLNVDTIPELVEALIWALGQPCSEDPSLPEHRLDPERAEELASAAWQVLHKHGTAVHWDSAERMVLPKMTGFSKWDLHYVLSTRSDLFERTGRACYRARKKRSVS